MSNLSRGAHILAAIGTLSTGVAAMDAVTVLDLLKGHTLVGEYASGATFRERFNDDGTTAYQDANGQFAGVASVTGGSLCFAYPTDDDLNGGCFTVVPRGANCFDFYSTDSPANAVQRRNALGWTARAWRGELSSTCTDVPVS